MPLLPPPPSLLLLPTPISKMCHASLLAYAEKVDPSDSSLLVVVVCLAILAAACACVAVPALIARGRRHRRSDAVAVLALLWGVVAAAVVISASMTHLKWSREKQLRLESGYYDPQDAENDAPPWPWVACAGLGAGYAGLIVWALAQKGPARRTPPTLPMPPR